MVTEHMVEESSSDYTVWLLPVQVLPDFPKLRMRLVVSDHVMSI